MRLHTPFAVLALISATYAAPARANVDVLIDEQNGCQFGAAKDQAKKMCVDYEYYGTKDKDVTVRDAYAACLDFYERALKLQNVFCSYGIDADWFKKTSEIATGTSTSTSTSTTPSDVGDQNKAEEAVAKDNERVYKIARAYLEKLSKDAPVFKKSYENYEAKIGKMNGAAGGDEVYESTCAAGLVSGVVPGYVREMLAAFAHNNATITWDSMWTAVRNNVRALGQVKKEAEENAKLAQLRAVNVGDIYKRTIETGIDPNPDKRPPVSQLEGATTGGAQYLFSMTMKQWFPKLSGELIAVVGGGAVLAYQIYTNKKVMYPESAATMIGMWNPALGAVATIVVAMGRNVQKTVLEYRQWARPVIQQNNNITAMQLVDLWGKHKNWDACVKNAAEEAACIELRKTTPPYDHSNGCSKSPGLGNGAGPIPTGPPSAPTYQPPQKNNNSNITGAPEGVSH